MKPITWKNKTKCDLASAIFVYFTPVTCNALYFEQLAITYDVTGTVVSYERQECFGVDKFL